MKCRLTWICGVVLVLGFALVGFVLGGGAWGWRRVILVDHNFAESAKQTFRQAVSTE